MRKLLSRESPTKVAVLRALQLGDMLCAIPALRALRAAVPQAHITLVGLPWARDLVGRFPNYFNAFLEIPGYPGLPERTSQPPHVAQFLANAQALQFDLAIQMHGNGAITNSLMVLLGARINAGFFQEGGYRPDLNNFLPYPDRDAEIRRLLQLMRFLGAPPQGEQLEFPILEEDKESLRAITAAAPLGSREYVCVHPGARSGTRWEVERFAAVADTLAHQGLRVVLTGSNEEKALAVDAARAMRAPSINLAGLTSLGALAALLSNARLLVCNDTGVAHLAAALNIPSVVIFSGPKSDPERWGPLKRDIHHAMVCRDRGFLVSPTPSHVSAVAQALLKRGPMYVN